MYDVLVRPQSVSVLWDLAECFGLGRRSVCFLANTGIWAKRLPVPRAVIAEALATRSPTGIAVRVASDDRGTYKSSNGNSSSFHIGYP